MINRYDLNKKCDKLHVSNSEKREKSINRLSVKEDLQSTPVRSGQSDKANNRWSEDHRLNTS